MKTVCFIDDNNINLTVYSIELKCAYPNHTFDILKYSNPRKFLEDLPSLPQIDLLFVDFMMPEMNGIALVNELVMLESHLQKLKNIYYLTAYSGMEKRYPINPIIKGVLIKPLTDVMLHKIFK